MTIIGIIIIIYVIGIFIPEVEYKCDICKDRGEVYVPYMSPDDWDYVKCDCRR